jgi:hypothetical protein
MHDRRQLGKAMTPRAAAPIIAPAIIFCFAYRQRFD